MLRLVYQFQLSAIFHLEHAAEIIYLATYSCIDRHHALHTQTEGKHRKFFAFRFSLFVFNKNSSQITHLLFLRFKTCGCMLPYRIGIHQFHFLWLSDSVSLSLHTRTHQHTYNIGTRSVIWQMHEHDIQHTKLLLIVLPLCSPNLSRCVVTRTTRQHEIESPMKIITLFSDEERCPYQLQL